MGDRNGPEHAATLQFLERRHELGLSTNLDEAGINSVRFAREVNDYGLLRTRKMWQDIERMKLNDEQHYFVIELYRFVLDLSLDITISDCIYVDHKVMQFRLCDEFLNMTRDHDITNVEEYGCELQNDGNARHRLKNYVSGVLALGESWGDELQRLVEIIMRNYSSEHVSSIFIGSGRISVEFL